MSLEIKNKKKIMNLKNSIYKLSFAAMISMMAMNATEIQAQGVVPAQKGEIWLARLAMIATLS